MEDTCTFVSCKGILKSCTFHSDNPKSSNVYDHSYLYDMLVSSKMFDGMSIYVCSELLPLFFSDIFPKIINKFVLVTGDSDLEVPCEVLAEEQATILLRDSKLLRWYSQNTLAKHPKLIQIPIGLAYHTIFKDCDNEWKYEGMFQLDLPQDQETRLLGVRDNMKKFWERSSKIFVNFDTKNDPYFDRRNSLDSISSDLLYVDQVITARTVLWKKMAQHAFILSPFGVGRDCLRTWETLLLGGIPIIKGQHFNAMFQDLPVLIVDEWSCVTQDLLDKTLNEFEDKHRKDEFNYKKLELSYWVNMIKNTRELDLDALEKIAQLRYILLQYFY